MGRVLDEQAVRRWISDQRAAQERIRSERTIFLLGLTAEEALRVHRSLRDSAPQPKSERPSPVLLAMRRALARLDDETRAS